MIAKPNSAIISWEKPTRAINYRVYLVIQEMLIPINDGKGLDVTINQVTMNSVFLFFFFKILKLKKKKKKKNLKKKKKKKKKKKQVNRRDRLYDSNLFRKFRRI